MPDQDDVPPFTPFLLFVALCALIAIGWLS